MRRPGTINVSPAPGEGRGPGSPRIAARMTPLAQLRGPRPRVPRGAGEGEEGLWLRDGFQRSGEWLPAARHWRKLK